MIFTQPKITITSTQLVLQSVHLYLFYHIDTFIDIFCFRGNEALNFNAISTDWVVKRLEVGCLLA